MRERTTVAIMRLSVPVSSIFRGQCDQRQIEDSTYDELIQLAWSGMDCVFNAMQLRIQSEGGQAASTLRVSREQIYGATFCSVAFPGGATANSVRALTPNLPAESIELTEVQCAKALTLAQNVADNTPVGRVTRWLARTQRCILLGQYDEAVVQTLTTADILVSQTLRSILCEHGHSAAVADGACSRPIRSCLTVLAAHLDGTSTDWEWAGAGVVGRFRERVYEARNSVGHRGDVATEKQAWAAYRSLTELSDMIREQLLAKPAKHPYTLITTTHREDYEPRLSRKAALAVKAAADRPGDPWKSWDERQAPPPAVVPSLAEPCGRAG